MKLFSLALVGLVALVAASPVETTAIAVPKYKNKGVHIYKCDSKANILSCVLSGACYFVEHCSTKCFADRHGAGCTGSATVAAEASEKRDTDIEVNAENKKTYECSNDHTGVLVCQYGFCQTDHYCKKGTKCRDKCSCCRNMDVLERGIDDLDTTKISQPVVESNTLASRANDPPQDRPCTPGTYNCLKTESGESWIVVCGWNGKYQYSSNCSGLKCLAWDDGVAHCWNPGKEWQSDPSSVSRRDGSASPYGPLPDGHCAPGTYTCHLSPLTNTAWIMVCGWNSKWQPSADCGDMKCVEDAVGVAHCWNPGEEWNANPFSVSRRDEPDQVPSDLSSSDNCQPGSFACDWRSSTQTSWIITCDQSGNWVWSSDCGRGMGCDYANGVAHCVPQKPTLEARNELLEVPADLAPMQICHPGEYSCTWSSATKTEWVVVCDQSGYHWQWSADCGKGMKCVSGGGVAHCVPRFPGTNDIAASTLTTVAAVAAALAKA